MVVISRPEGYLISRREIGGPLRFLHGDNMIHLKILYVIEAYEFPLCHTQIRMVLNTNFINILCNSFFPFKGTLFIFEKITNLVALKGISCKEYLNISASFLSSWGVIYWFQFDDDWALQRRVRGETPIEDPINLPGGKAIGERVC